MAKTPGRERKERKGGMKKGEAEAKEEKDLGGRPMKPKKSILPEDRR
jgi:hypothetical protein